MPATTRLRKAAVASAAAVLIITLAGCSTAGPSRSGSTKSATPTAVAAAPEPSPTEKPCWEAVGGIPVTVAAKHPIQAVFLGTGTRVVVISNQSNGDLCPWLPFAQQLVTQGMRVALFNYNDEGDAKNVRDVVAYIRKNDLATSIGLLGGSDGAKAVVMAGAAMKPQPDAVVSLSPEISLEGVQVEPFAAKLRAPTLYVTMDDDPYGSTQPTQDFYAASPSADRKLILLPGRTHGILLLQREDVNGAVVTFLTDHVK